jgi:hydrogenase-4 membrane subunit HyfE
MRKIVTNPILLWILSVISLGHFVILWSWLLAKEANRNSSDRKLSIRVHAKILAGSYVVLVAMYFILFSHRLFPGIETSAIFPHLHLVYLGVFFLMLADILYLIGATTRMINLVSNEYVPPAGVMMIGLFLLFAPLPYLQARLNRVVAEHNQSVEDNATRWRG